MKTTLLLLALCCLCSCSLRDQGIPYEQSRGVFLTVTDPKGLRILDACGLSTNRTTNLVSDVNMGTATYQHWQTVETVLLIGKFMGKPYELRTEPRELTNWWTTNRVSLP